MIRNITKNFIARSFCSNKQKSIGLKDFSHKMNTKKIEDIQ